ncbi:MULTISPECIES: phage distal tail protein [Streptomyces]|uniref:phage distal tail protein n=1 Tax=Streptomyces TaxID=1883 RepID=UPI002270070D|nr:MULTISPECIES: phage tail domain-containing protein [unclassified Streptomyces]MCY0921660.1 phage tail family protein [Streptomyces sp. H27-G5]MCY0943993.1 phage tail family protein [Streptomyces sp. H34-AA3]MCY0956287.1 phage tail family protein [Streptomyces sp. H27-H5]MCZ4082307.1 phage tail family protein [Streptomyces sp. H34-S5]
MTALLLESERDVLDLNGVADEGVGYQATAGATGFGLPSVAAQWLEGAGDGSRFRGRRILPRDLDIPLDIVGQNRAHLGSLISRLARVVSEDCTLALVDEQGVRWSTPVVWTGGGELDLDGATDVQTVISFRAPDPYFTASTVSTQSVVGDPGTRPFLSAISSMPLAASQAIGSIQLDNGGDVPAYPVWEIYGPGRDLTVTSPTGETLRWTGSLTAAEKLVVDTRAGTVIDGKGANRYSLLDSAPRFWTVPPGVSTASVRFLDTTAASRIVCSWRPRRWMVI